MKLRDEIFQEELIDGNMDFWGVAVDPLEQMDPPTAGDVTRNLDHFDRLIYERGKENIIHVNKPG